MADIGDAMITTDCHFPGWELFIPQLVHPLKVAIVEALLYIGEPLSAVQFGKLFASAGNGFRESNVRYHLSHLNQIGVLEVIAGRGELDEDSKQKYFYFAAPGDALMRNRRP